MSRIAKISLAACLLAIPVVHAQQDRGSAQPAEEGPFGALR